MRATLTISPCLLILIFSVFWVEVTKGQDSERLEIIVPIDGTSTYSDEIFTVAFIPESLSSEVQLMTGRGPVSLSIRGLYAHGTVRLALGPNVVRIEAWGRDGNVAVTEVKVFRKARSGKAFRVGFEPYRFHTPDMEERCVRCHTMIQDPDSSKVTAMPDPVCWKCHFEKAFQRYTHTSLSQRGCFACHKRDSEPTYSIEGKPGELCLGCHEKLRNLGTKAFAHGPVTTGHCDVCHDPHGSQYEEHVRMRVPDLCVMCHENVLAEMMMSGAHLPFRKGDCLRCHVAHWSDSESGLVEDPAILCERCHKIQPRSTAHPHPGFAKPTSDAGRQLPWLMNGKLQCISCHNPHAAEVDGLLRASLEQGCNSCHTK